jgi:hypothetical protein
MATRQCDCVDEGTEADGATSHRLGRRRRRRHHHFHHHFLLLHHLIP